MRTPWWAWLSTSLMVGAGLCGAWYLHVPRPYVVLILILGLLQGLLQVRREKWR